MKKRNRYFYCFIPKKCYWKTSLQEDFLDIHSHYLPGVDDGMQTIDESVKALVEMRDKGLKGVYFTPHIMEENPENHYPFLQKKFAAFQEHCPEGVETRLAGEYMLDGGFRTHLEEGLLTFSHKGVLVEMSPLFPSPRLEETLYDIQIQGYQTVLAHPERYVFMNIGKYSALKQKGCLFQLNLLSLSGFYGRFSYETAWSLLKGGYYDFAGTDIHNYESFRKAMNHLKASASEQKIIQEVMDNNKYLW